MLILRNQSIFVKGRSITKDVLLAWVIISDTKLRGKTSNVVIKIDISKEYNRVE